MVLVQAVRRHVEGCRDLSEGRSCAGGAWNSGTSHITVVCSSPVAALALCSGVQ